MQHTLTTTKQKSNPKREGRQTVCTITDKDWQFWRH